MQTITIGAGDLKYRVTLQRQDVTRNDLGEEVPAWVDHLTVWADVKPLSTRMWLSSMEMQTTVTHEIVMRYRPVDPLWRIKWGAVLLDIVGEPVMIGRRQFLRITAATRQRDARP